MPLKAIHAQEQRNRVVDLDIDGTLSLLFAANRNYPIENTYVSIRVAHRHPFRNDR